MKYYQVLQDNRPAEYPGFEGDNNPYHTSRFKSWEEAVHYLKLWLGPVETFPFKELKPNGKSIMFHAGMHYDIPHYFRIIKREVK